MQNHQEILDILKGSVLTRGMTEEETRALLASSRVRLRSLAKGEIVFHEGDTPRGLYLLIEGALVIKKDTFSGRQIFLSELEEPGEMFGEVYEVLGLPYDMYVEAMTSARILALESALFSLAGGDLSRPALLVQQNLMRIFARKAYFMHNKIKVLASGSLREKIVRFLFQNLRADGVIELNVSREYLAAYLAVTRPSLSREFSAMVRDGILEVNGRSICVVDMEAFEAYL